MWYGTYASVTVAYAVLHLCIDSGAVCGTVLMHQYRYQCRLIELICAKKIFMVLTIKSNIFSNKNCIKKSHWKIFMVLTIKRI